MIFLKIRAKKQDKNLKNINKMLHYESLLNILKIIKWNLFTTFIIIY